ncbi:MAG: RIP metalloprotease RseP [Treponema sp.]|jgi:regulator of sigma E protease|nr:RIP metalloprotease RseP [Treponema sp.]
MQILIKILLGLMGLGIVVFVHELGHFIAARRVGIDVEAFSIGWGRPFLRKKIGAVEYRLGVFPLGGYCKMKGENEFQEAWENRQKSAQTSPGAFFSASPFRRIIVSFMGPFFNLVFAALVLSAIWGIGFEVITLDNRIVLVSEISPGSLNPADEAGLKTGDRILEIKGRNIENYHDIQEIITLSPEEELSVKVDRAGELIALTVRPGLEKSTGAGRIGVYAWVDPLIGTVAENSPAALAGLKAGDRLLKAAGRDLPHTMALSKILEEKPGVLELEFERDGARLSSSLVPVYSEPEGAGLGIGWQTIRYHTPRLSPFGALAKGLSESWKTLTVSIRSLGLLFRGIDLTQAVSGPVRITYMVGAAAAEGFGQSIGTGISTMANFLALISIALCIMNLLPLPILDGGMIVLFAIEGITRKPLHPRAVYIFQTVGVVLIFGLMIFAVFGDILYLAGR